MDYLNQADLTREKFKNILKIPSDIRSECDLHNLMSLTSNFKIFESISGNNLHKEICKYISLKCFSKGEVICKQGDEGDAYYYILKGAVDIYIYNLESDTGKIKLIQIGSIGSGFGFGELSLLYDCPRTATCVSSVISDLIVIKKKIYNTFVKDLHEKELYDLVNFYSSLPILKKESLNNILRLCLKTNKKNVNAMKPLYKVGDYIDNYYFIAKGTVKVLVKLKFNKNLLDNICNASQNTFVKNTKMLNKKLLDDFNFGINKSKDIDNELHIDYTSQLNNNNKLQLKNLNRPKSCYNIASHKKNKDEDCTVEEVICIMEYKAGDMVCEYYAAKQQKLNVYILCDQPSQLMYIRVDDFKKISPDIQEDIAKHSINVFSIDNVLIKLYDNLKWKTQKEKLLKEALTKK